MSIVRHRLGPRLLTYPGGLKMSEEEARVFGYSLRLPTLVFFLMGLFLISDASRYLLTVQDGFVGALVLFPPAAFFLYGFGRYFRARVSKGSFFEDHFEVYGKGLHESLLYEEVKDVQLTHHTSILAPHHLTIYLKRENTPLLLIANPRSKTLKIDLSSWLLQKTQGS